MSDEPRLRLVDDREPDVLPFERRHRIRHVVNHRVTAILAHDRDDAVVSGIRSLEVVNMSEGGLGAMVQQPLPLNTRMTVLFPPHGAEQGFDVTGCVVRCQARDGRYDLGLTVNTRMAA